MNNELMIMEEVTSDDVFVRQSENDSIYTTSVDIAKKFNKSHKNIMNMIDKIIESNKEAKYMFHIAYFRIPNGNTYPMYCCNKNGFMLIIMRFRGKDIEKKRLEYIDQYINAFNDLETKMRVAYANLKKQYKNTTTMPPRGSKEFLALALLDAQEIINKQEKTIEEMKPAQQFKNAFLDTKDCMLIRDFSKVLAQHLQEANIPKKYIREVGEKHLFAWFRVNGYLTRQGKHNHMPSQISKDKDLFRAVVVTTSVNGKEPHIHEYAKLTSKGVVYFIEKITKIYENEGTIIV